MTRLYAHTVRLKLETGNEVEAFVRIAANGIERPRCLLLHGNPGSLLDWEQLLPFLAGVADIALIDLPGFGKSGRVGADPEFMSLDRLAEYTIAAANALGWREPIFLVGHSHGGGVAQAAAAQYPGRVAGLVLIGTLGASAYASYRLLSLPGAAAVARAVGRMFRFELLRPLNCAILRAVMSDISSPEPVLSEKLEHELSSLSSRPEILVSMVHVTLGRPCRQLSSSASAIRCPVLFVHGREDALVPARRARPIHERILSAGGRSQFQIIRGGHLLINYQASELAKLVIEHLRNSMNTAIGNQQVGQ